MFKKLFGRKSNESNSPIYRFLDIDVSELAEYSNGIDQLQNREVDGFLIRNVFTPKEIDTIVSNYEKVSVNERTEANSGMIVFPQPFSVVDQTSDNSREKVNEYYAGTEAFWNGFEDRFGVNLVARCSETLEKIGGGRNAIIPKGEQGEGSYHPATFKHLVPGKGEFKAHCGNFFHREFPTFYAHMKEISIIKNQMSYFVMLKPSEYGGELTLYDVSWEEAEIRLNGDTKLEGKRGEIYDLLDDKQVKRIKLTPSPGDMIVFSGGRIWHKVEVARGSERYTIGGFLCRSSDDKDIYMWS